MDVVGGVGGVVVVAMGTAGTTVEVGVADPPEVAWLPPGVDEVLVVVEVPLVWDPLVV